MDQSKVEGVLNWPTQFVKELRDFWGCYYYKSFIKGYGVMVKPLTFLLKKDANQHWTNLTQQAFQQLKDAIRQAPMLVLPDFHETLCVETDACGQGVGAMLQQKGRPMAFFSKALGMKH